MKTLFTNYYKRSILILSFSILPFFSAFSQTNASDSLGQMVEESAETRNQVVMSRDTLNALIDAAKKLESIEKSSKETSINTEPTFFNKTDIDEYIILFLSLIAAVGTLLTYKGVEISTKTIKGETEKQRIRSDIQKDILKDLVRHFYRNKVVVCTLEYMLKEKGFDKFYPSEEHILKLKVLPEDQRFDKFDNLTKHYNELHMLELKFRNFNVEADVAIEHLKDRELSDDIKLYDLDTMAFKAQQLTKEILVLMGKLNFNWTIEEVTQYLTEESKAYQKNPDGTIAKSTNKRADIEVPPRIEKRNYYDKTLKLTDVLNEDIQIEHEILRLIPFH